jgi:hypothetical protein
MAKRMYFRRIDGVLCTGFKRQSATLVLTCAVSLVCLLAACGETDSKSRVQSYRISAPAKGPITTSSSPSPFSVSIVSGTNNSLTMSKKTEWADEFYVVLINISKEPQPVWEYWNGWGFQVISFELTTAEGKLFVLTVKDRGFDKNVPSTFIVAPSEHQVFSIRLDDSWQVQPALTVVDGMPVTLKAVYQVNPTRESTGQHVWTGRIESHSYSLSLWQCPPSCSPLFTHGVRP